MEKIKCRFCGSKNIAKRGFRKTQNRGLIQRYICRKCNKSFAVNDGFLRMRNNPNKITSAIDLYLSNLSSRKTRNFFRRHLEHNASHVTILNWCLKYIKRVDKYTRKLKPNISGKIYLDETEINCKGKYHFLWVGVDWDTRFIPSSQYTTFRSCEKAREIFDDIKSKGNTKFVQTDSAMFYPYAFRKSFAYHKRKNNEVEHRVINTRRTGKYNVRIETVFSKLKDRIDDFRSLKSKECAEILIKGLILQHNFIEQHSTTGKIPCELAGINLELGKDRWMDLIKLSSMN